MELLLLSMGPEQVNRYTPMVQLHMSMVHRGCDMLGTMNLCTLPWEGRRSVMEVRQVLMVPDQIDRYTPMVQLHRSMIHRECDMLGTMNPCYIPMGGLEECHGS